MSSMIYRRGPRWLAGSLVAAAIVSGAAVWHGQSVAGDTPVAQTPQHQKEAGYAKSLSHAFRTAANSTLPSVVTITSEIRAHQVRGNQAPGQRGENPFKGTPFEDFFNDRGGAPFNFQGPQSMPRSTGVGAGVIIDRSGTILTNNHVVEGATEVMVRLADGREFKATDIKTDPQTDLAVLHIKGAGELPAATMGDSDALEIGDWVIAVGNPFNQELTVSAGIISGKGRNLRDEKRTQYLQTDAAINPGNSGGPLVDLDGNVVGINTAIASSSGGFQGVGFAVPINQAKWVVEQLVKGGAVKRAYLGVRVGDISGDLAEQLGVHRHQGVFVNEVMPDSPAAKAGLQEGDVITEYGGKHVGAPGELQSLVERAPLDRAEDVKIIRDHKPMTVGVMAAALPDDTEPKLHNVRGTVPETKDPSAFAAKELGLEVAELKSAQAEQLGFKGHAGVVITNVVPDSLAAEQGLREGMLIKKVGDQYVTNVDEFKQALNGKTTEHGILLLVRSRAGNSFVVLKD